MIGLNRKRCPENGQNDPQNGPFDPKSISRELLVVETSQTAHFNRNTHFSISVSYNIYPLEQEKWLKLTFWLKMAEISPKSISREPLMV